MNITGAVQSSADLIASKKYARASAEVTNAVKNASAKTGVDFSYLMEKAAAESDFQTDAKADTSSATGLYQFIDSTWLNTVKQHGAEYGLGRYANAIRVRSDGTPVVQDQSLKKEILDLRTDPEVSALMAGAFTKDNADYLKQNTSGNVGSTELYMAHFLGASGGAKFLNQMEETPNGKAADLFPEAAAANRSVFYDSAGKAKTYKQIYDHFATKFDGSTGSAASVVTDTLKKGVDPDGFTVQVPSWTATMNKANPLSIYQVLALNALETPDEADEDDGTKSGKSDNKTKRMRHEAVRTEQTGDAPLGLGIGRGLQDAA